MRRSLGIMGELEDQYDRDKKKSYSDSKYSTFIQREQNDPCVKMNKHQGDVFCNIKRVHYLEKRLQIKYSVMH